MSIKDLIEENYLLRRTYVSDDYIKALHNLTKACIASYRDFIFKSGEEFNGWVIPKKWTVKKAEIKLGSKIIYDGLAHPLGVISNSSTFKGKISKKELLKHLFFSNERPHAIPYHFRLQYRPWDKDWGFCVPKTFADSLKNAEYEVALVTKLEDGKMIVREFSVKGSSDASIIFAAHLDHPGMCNDDLSGCAVGIHLMNAILKKYGKPKFTYKLLITQEIVGSVFYLNSLPKKELKEMEYGLFLEMLGNNNTLNLQKSLKGETYVDKLCELALKKYYRKPRICNFRESAGNDEIVFESPGIEIPMPSISRWPYPEYHTSDDNINLMKEEKLQEALEYLMSVVNIFENDGYVKRNFSGLLSFANPKYDIYIDPGQIITSGIGSNKEKTLFQYKMPRYLEGNYRISDLASTFGLDFEWVVDYYRKMQKLGLVKISLKPF